MGDSGLINTWYLPTKVEEEEEEEDDDDAKNCNRSRSQTISILFGNVQEKCSLHQLS